MEERVKFVARINAGERMTDVCRELGISRKTGYKFLERFERLSVVGLVDESRAPRRIPHRTSSEVEELIVELRRKHSTWGPRKLLAFLEGKHPGIELPAHSTVAMILKRRGLVVPRRRRSRPEVAYSPLCHAEQPNDVMCIDYKGQFRLGNGKLCYPLTITDAYSRFILACEAFASIDGDEVQRVLEEVFRKRGLPGAIRSDNGAPFGSRGLWGWSQLSVWLSRLGVRIEHIEPASPEQNGRHERMHRTLKLETTRPAAANELQQQERFDRFMEIFNEERPHEALGQRPPASVYRSSTRAFPEKLPEPEYPLHDLTAIVDDHGHLRVPGVASRRSNIFLASAFRGQRVGLRELDDDVWLVSFLKFDLGEAHLKAREFKPYSPSTSPV
jgi:putative transposase